MVELLVNYMRGHQLLDKAEKHLIRPDLQIEPLIKSIAAATAQHKGDPKYDDKLKIPIELVISEYFHAN